MDNNAITTSAGGLGFIDALQLIFIVLKLCGVIDWAWVVVLIPLWVSLGLIVLVGLFILVLWLINSR